MKPTNTYLRSPNMKPGTVTGIEYLNPIRRTLKELKIKRIGCNCYPDNTLMDFCIEKLEFLIENVESGIDEYNSEI